MVRILEDPKTGDVVVQTNCLNVQDYLVEMATALAHATKEGDRELRTYQCLQRAMPIAFKLAGYKSEEVSEWRTLVCGTVSPDYCTEIGRGGRVDITRPEIEPDDGTSITH